MTTYPDFTAGELDVLERKEDLTPSQWAERYRYLPRSTAEPGPWKNERTPYLVGIMDAINEDGFETGVVIKGVQLGFSEATRNVIGYLIDHARYRAAASGRRRRKTARVWI